MPHFTSLSDALNNPAKVTHLEIDEGEDANKALARLCEFTKLRRLYLANGFTGLPKGVTAPASLTELQVVVADLESESKCIIEALPGLEVLEIWGQYLKQGTLPTEISKIAKLRELHLVACGVSDLPSTLSALTSLRELYVRDCPIEKFPEAITEIPHLQRLDLNSEIPDLPNTLAKLQELRYLNLCGSLNHGIDGLDAEYLKPIPTVIGSLGSLEVLNLGECGVNNEFKALQALTQLRVLNISWGQTSDLSGLRSLSLEELDISNCCKICDLSPLEALPKLRALYLQDCSIKDISGISGLSRLKKLNIERCDNITNLAPILRHATLETLRADDKVIANWEQRQRFCNMPSETVLLEQLAATEYSVVAKALEQIIVFVLLNSTGDKSAAFGFFGVEHADEALVDVPVLDAALEKWGSELPSSLLIGLARMCMVVITENLKPALTAIRLLAARGDVEAQKKIAVIFHSACFSYDAGHRGGSILLDQLIDDVFKTFHPTALVDLLHDHDFDALNPDSGDAMDLLFQVALSKTDTLDEETTATLVDTFCHYAKEMFEHGDADHLEDLRRGIREVNEAAGKAIDEELQRIEQKQRIQKQVQAIDSAEALSALLNEEAASFTRKILQLDEVISFSGHIVKYWADLDDKLRLQVLHACWQANLDGWNWAQLTLNEIERDPESLREAMHNFMLSESGDDKTRNYLLENLISAKHIRLSAIDGDPGGTDAVTEALLGIERKLSGQSEQAALAHELSHLLGIKDWPAAMGILRRIAAQEATIMTDESDFRSLYAYYMKLITQAKHHAVKEFLQVFVASTRNINWGQAAIETIAADGVASALHSGDEEISELVFVQLMPETIETDRLAFNLACYCACKQDRDNVLRYTRRALALGKDSAQFRADTDFALFWEDAEFKALFD